MPPALAVRAFAEMLDLPMYAQLRILREQKYPRQMPTPYRVSHYQQALAAIRHFYDSGRQMRILQNAITVIQASSMPDARKRNNIRVIQAFRQSSHVRRQLVVHSRTRARLAFHGVMLRSIADMEGTEGSRSKYIFFNVRQARITPNIAKATLELAHLVLTGSGLVVQLGDMELIDLADRGRRYRIGRVRARTLQRSAQNARAIAQLWNGI